MFTTFTLGGDKYKIKKKQIKAMLWLQKLWNTSENMYIENWHQSGTDQQCNGNRWEKKVSQSWHHLHCTTDKQHSSDSQIARMVFNKWSTKTIPLSCIVAEILRIKHLARHNYHWKFHGHHLWSGEQTNKRG